MTRKGATQQHAAHRKNKYIRQDYETQERNTLRTYRKRSEHMFIRRTQHKATQEYETQKSNTALRIHITQNEACKY